MKYRINSNGNMKKEVKARLESAVRMTGEMSEAVQRRKVLSKKTKWKVTLVYGCEVWNMSKQQESRVQATQMRVLRRIEGVSRVDRVRSEDIRLRKVF